MPAKKNNPNQNTSDREIIVTRVFDAPRELVFKVWTDLKNVTHWWGPRGFSTINHEINLKPGGLWRFIMRGPDGTDYQNRILFQEIVAPERLVYIHGSDDEPDQFHVKVTFTEVDAKTKVTLWSIFPSAEKCETVKKFGAVEGGNQTMERFGECLAKAQASMD